MSAFLYGIIVQWKLDLRNKGIILTYYIVPIVFFLFMSGIFTSVDPMAYKTLISSMTVFGVTMGSIIGSPTPLVEFFSSPIKKAYIVGKIPLWTIIVNNFISSFIHLFIMALIIFFLAPIAFDAVIPSNIFVYFINLFIFISTCLSVGTVLGLFVKNTSKLTMISQFIFLPSIMLSGIMFPSDMLPKFLKSIGRLFPATWGYENMYSSNFDIYTLLPLIIISFICILIILQKLKNLKSD
ncbi:ABC transporter [[Clostridium] sordellii]|uniref:ABC transporter permease n=1 Tax=Paraclostridium sordellii TaxID=1505 RepID=UPI0005DD622A|nr:ABC transporter permease [Paeniclostridium sordellii]MDU2148346.1 ABC transporter permease [Paeniclostridium sordellii]MDU4414394.1 ABC transporter permease [Paeniclostridium sordellii]MRZ30195.1 ABC transporter permease [Paeniclostridium sordellii]MVO75936.1 ABC transporter permease [Paeniclostridium sordellii]CEN83974.1 ABC transporter [[Clostridium] sordellii] [Paeniclostridium sordellii]